MSSLVITNAGVQLMAKLAAGKATSTFTKLQLSSKQYSTGDLEGLTSLSDVKQEVTFSSINAVSTGTVKLTAVAENTSIKEGFTVNTLGLITTDRTNEILYAVIDISGEPDFQPAYDAESISRLSYAFTIQVGKASSVTVNVTQATSSYEVGYDGTESGLKSTNVQDAINEVYSNAKEFSSSSSKVIDSHAKTTVVGEDGVHGLRFYNDVLQFYNQETHSWVDIETGGGGIAPSNVVGPKVKIGNAKLTIAWGDPGDTVVGGQTICTWKGTKLVQKAGSFPTNIKDGTVLLDNQVKDAYATNGFEINGLTNDTTYYFQLFPYSDKNAVNENAANRLTGTPQPFRKMTAIIDLSNSNPTSSVTYADDAVGMTPGSAAWDEFFGHYPVLFKNGAEVGKLKTTDYTKFEDGSAADITSGNAGDVMVAFPRRGVKITTIGNILTISMTDDPDNADFEYLAHTRGSTRKEKFYLGAYKGFVDSNKLRSWSGKLPTASQTIGTFRTQAQANGSGYEQSGFYQLTFRQCMYILKYKNLNSQTAVGRGYVDGNSAAIATGGTNAKGMDFGETTGKLQMKLFGLEDFWGNLYEWIDGIVTNSTRNMLTATDGFNDTGSGYTDQGQGATANIGNYMSKPQGTTKTGFLAKEVSGSETTYFCDYASLYASCVASFGGSWGRASAAGAFRLNVNDASSNSGASIAARLMYL